MVTHQFIAQYNNGASVKTIYHPKADPKFNFADRIELTFKTEKNKLIGTRMSFAEAITVIKLLSQACDAFMDDKSNNPDFDIPLEAR